MRVAIIGAGAAGLVAGRYAIESGFECEILEMTPELGGIWVYVDETEKDKYGFPVYSPMYKGLRANCPKEVMGFSGFPIPEREDCYLTQSEILYFMNQFAEHFSLKQLIKFNRLVTEIRPVEDKWQIKSIDKPTRTEIVDIYDYVMVCNGHFHEPVIPTLLGQEKFKGKIFHSYQFRSSESFKDQRVLVVGAGPSGLDITLQLSACAKYVVLSHHRKVVESTQYSSNVTKKPDVLRVKSDEEVEFTDGSCWCFDAILFCTGYKYSFPFLHESCGVTVKEHRVQPLYKHMVHIDRPSMCFIGIPYYACAFPMCDIQARFYCSYLSGSMALPPPEVMREETERKFQERLARGFKKTQAHLLGDEQQAYFDDLAAAANISSVPPVTTKLWQESLRLLYSDFTNFRDLRYKIVDDETFVRI